MFKEGLSGELNLRTRDRRRLTRPLLPPCFTTAVLYGSHWAVELEEQHALKGNHLPGMRADSYGNLYGKPCKQQGLLPALTHPQSQSFGLGLIENWMAPKSRDSQRNIYFISLKDFLDEGWDSREHLPVVDAPVRHPESNMCCPATPVGVRNVMMVATSPEPLAASFVNSSNSAPIVCLAQFLVLRGQQLYDVTPLAWEMSHWTWDFGTQRGHGNSPLWTLRDNYIRPKTGI